MSEAIGLKLNHKRTQIVRLDGHFEYLKKRVHLTETGKVVMRLTRKNITKHRQLLRKQKKMLDEGRIDFETIWRSYQSWRGYAVKYDTFQTVRSMDALFDRLFIADFTSGKENYGSRICKSAETTAGSTERGDAGARATV